MISCSNLSASAAGKIFLQSDIKYIIIQFTISKGFFMNQLPLYMHRFKKELIQYWHYIIYYVRAFEKARVTNTSLGYLWWFLDPLLNMGIYIILVRLVFNQRDPNFPVFFFSAMLVWRYFSMALAQSVSSIRSNIGVCRDIYVPKFVFPLVMCITGLSPLIISMGILVALMIMFHVPFTINLIYLPLLLTTLFFFTLTCSMIVAHIGVFVADAPNILNHLLTLGLFATPVFYSIDRMPQKYQFFIKLNPVGTLTTSFRHIITYGTPPPFKQLLYILVFTVIAFVLSVMMLYKYDKIYNRVNG